MNTVETPLYTPDDLLAMPDGDLYELVDGRLVERNMGTEASYVGTRLVRLLANFVEDRDLGWVLLSDTGYRCFPNRPKLVRKPDISYVRAGRFPGGVLPKGDTLFAPDLVVEVVSPNDLYYEIEEKVAEYRSAGVPLVWIVSPPTKTILVRRPDGTGVELPPSGELDGENVLPGFRCPVSDVFRSSGSSPSA